jgi:GH25 family lysozyme M1 (1,4-beta-N-acetylmuramidase)
MIMIDETKYAFGIDISRYNYSADGTKKPDFAKINTTCDFVAVRAGISWGYTDPWFSYSWEHVKGNNRLAYHVPYFGESAEKQVDNLFKIVVGSDWTHDRLVLDAELSHNLTKYRIMQTMNQMLELCRQMTGRYPIIYSRANWIDAYLDVNALPADIDWWLANYLYARPYPLYTPEKEPPPYMPKGVTKWLIHQTAEKYSGAEVGVASYYVDSNRWNGGIDAVSEYFGRDEQPEPEPMTLEERVADHERRIKALEAKI